MKDFLLSTIILIGGIVASSVPFLPQPAAAQGYLLGASGKRASEGGASYIYYSAAFDGTNDYATRGADLTGSADGKEGTFSCWLKMDAGSSDTTNYYILANTASARFSVFRNLSGRVVISGKNVASGTILDLKSGTNAATNASGWHHVIGSWNLATSTIELYIDGADVKTSSSSSDDTIDYTRTNWGIGALPEGGNKMHGLLCELVFHPANLDITSSTIREKFRTVGGKPADIATTNPFGVTPLIYLKQEVPDWEANQGTGGGFTEVGAIGDGGADIP